MIPQLAITDSFISSVADASPSFADLFLDYVKQHIRALGDADDTLTLVRINGAVSYFEEMTGRQVVTATREAWLNAFPFIGLSGSDAGIELPRPPLLSVEDVFYVNENGDTVSFNDGASPAANLFTMQAPVGPYARRGWVLPNYGQMWPMAREQRGAVRIRYTCGYGSTPDEIPALVRGILCYLVAHFDQFPSATVDGTVNTLPLGMQAMMDGFKYSALPSQVLRQYGWGAGAPWWPRV